MPDPPAAQIPLDEVQTLAPPSAKAILLVSPSQTFPLKVEVELEPLILMKPAKVEVDWKPLTFKRVEIEVEPVISAPPVSTVNCCPDVILPEEVMLLELVMNPEDTPAKVDVA